MAKKKHQFLDDLGTQEMINILLELFVIKIDERVVDTINESSDTEHMPSVTAFNTFFTAYTTGISASTQNKYDDLSSKVDQLDADKEAAEIQVETVKNMSHLRTELVIGDLDTEVTSPEEDVIYFHKDSASSTACVLYTYVSALPDPWVKVGDTKPAMNDLWKKEDISLLKLALDYSEQEYVPLTDAEIKTKVDTAWNNQ